MGRSSSQNHSRWSTSRWATTLLLSMASSTASALSLSNFQVLTSPAIPISCILAYNSQIEGCRVSDFTKGNTCSQACVNGLLKIQATLEYVCNDTRVRVDSVIGQVLQGNLVRLLCPGNSSPGTTTIISSPLPTPSSTRTRSPVATTSSTLSRSSSTLSTRVPSLTFTTVRPPTSSATSTQELDETETETESESESSTATTTNDRGLTSSAPIPTFVQSEPPVSTDQATSTTDISTPEPTADSGEETAAGLPESGGGSPFDAFGASSSQPRQFVGRGFEAVMIALGISLLLLR